MGLFKVITKLIGSSTLTSKAPNYLKIYNVMPPTIGIIKLLVMTVVVIILEVTVVWTALILDKARFDPNSIKIKGVTTCEHNLAVEVIV